MTDEIQRNTDYIVRYLLSEIGFFLNPEAFILGVQDKINEYGDEEELAFGSLEYAHHDAFINDQFDYHLRNALTNDQKEKLKSYLPESQKLRIDACSSSRRELEISFVLKIQNAKKSASYSIFVEIKFPSFQGSKFTYTGTFLEDISKEEISELALWASLKS